MKLTHYIYISAALTMLTACGDDEIATPAYTVGEAINAITLRAGIADGGAGVMTRAVDGNHSKHVNFTNDTQLRLRVDGTWTNKTSYTLPHGSVSNSAAIQTTTASTGVTTGTGNLHNEVDFEDTERLYWDDYGTADPDNKNTGRAEGLTIYGVAVNGEASAPVVSNWASLNWTLSADQSQTNVWGKEDLLISNNIKVGNDGTLKFDDLYPTPQSGVSNIMEFTHAMSKITINLIAGEGFPTTGVGATTKKFGAEPEVVLTSNLYGETSKTEWANTKYVVDVMTGTIVTESNTPVAITTKTTKTDDTEITVVKEALVMPGSTFADNTQLLSILADDNRYYVSSEKIRAKMYELSSSTDYKTEPGKNYVLKVIVNKTGIDVTATIKNWEDVTADPVTPIINFSQCYGETGTDFGKGFTLYRSTTKEGSYIDGLTEGNKSTVSLAASKYTMSPQLYWPTHSTHYFFRGVWPQVNTTDGPVTEKVKANAVEVTNVAYAQGKYPSDLMIGMPRKADGSLDEHCKSSHNEDGICATDAAEGATHPNEGLIHLNFRYMMSQIKVELTSSASTDPDYIAFNVNTKVEIIGGYKDGAIKLSDGTADFTGKTAADYELHNKATDDYDSYHDAVIPQDLTEGMKFRITVKNSDGSTDTYETVIKNIKVKEGSADPALISAWASGKAYTYNLKITKTAINVTATLTDWVPVEASENVWF